MWQRGAAILGLVVSSVSAQLIPSGSPIPRTSKPPVVFLNGYQQSCPGSFSGTFGIADQILQAEGEVSIFFDNCSVMASSGRPSIEAMGAAFGSFLGNLKYADAQPVDTVDVVAHSMGGLIVRSYLSGKQASGAAFNPPPATHIRKAVFIAVPNFGTGLASTALGAGASDIQLQEMSSGSQFLFDLATWNQDTDDLRGVDAVGVAGNGGTGRATTEGFDDGVVALTSASLGFYLPGRTRVVPYCHIEGGGLITLAGLCPASAPGIARMTSAMHATAQIMVSFLNGTTSWESVGVAAEDDPLLSTNGGLLATARTAADAPVAISSATAAAGDQTKSLNVTDAGAAYTDMLHSGSLLFQATVASLGLLTETTTLPAGVYAALVAKPGPLISRVLPAASSTFPLNVAPGEIVSIYGTNLAGSTTTAGSIPLPLKLGDAQVLVNGDPIPLYYASATQINAVLPNVAGLLKVTVLTSSGTHTVNALAAPAVPALFTQNGSGIGAASVQRFPGYTLVTATNPLQAGDYAIVYLTGLGHTTPTVTIGGQDCIVAYAGPAAIYPGLDQINCQVPQGIAPGTAVPILVTTPGRTSNAPTVSVE
jgi:uncharacterized protein (TIGR03437 family)